MDYFELSPTPTEEACAQVGMDGYDQQAKKEGQALINQLNRMFPEAKSYGVVFILKPNSHDFGTYYEVVAKYDRRAVNGERYACFVENHIPKWWDEQARAELGLRKLPFDDQEANDGDNQFFDKFQDEPAEED